MDSDLLALPPQDISHKLPKNNLLQGLGKSIMASLLLFVIF